MRIEGPAYDVDSHYHISHLVGLVVEGKGWLNVPRGGASVLARKGARWVHLAGPRGKLNGVPGVGVKAHEEMGFALTAGDVVVLPRGAFHVFRCFTNGRMEYIALEFSDYQTDYQAHHD